MLISVHIPKTAGTSLGNALTQTVGDKLLLDYADKPLSDDWQHRYMRLRRRLQLRFQPQTVLNTYQAVHGHFIADKYAFLGETAQFCTFFREPIARLVSHYWHWQRHPDLQNSMCRQLISQQLSITAFANLPKQRQFYALFCGKIPLNQFHFVGLTEAYADSIALFNKLFNLNLPVLMENEGQGQDYAQWLKEQGAYIDIQAIQQENQRHYSTACRRFEQLCTLHFNRQEY
ncbi:Sulfotransferase family [Beggiatoa alba B18LD]|uniref:Sulfotransferase family n=1 Tax=Beggiatoa alba B18LD TaxID=395493 RepID=I3CDB9_9GAMM|nr:sulfotransferase family 2 domain-containing protein [Beggiatoa alba]EIJ41612.1 Sulfotransferase family [Beggiatoa alba B18LD]